MDMPASFETASAAFSPSVAQYELLGRRDALTGANDMPALKRRVPKPHYVESFGTIDISVDDVISEHVKAQIAKASAQYEIKRRVNLRLCELQIDALLAGEPFSEASYDDLHTLLSGLTLGERPSIFLLDNGNLRALWRNEQGEQVGLQFMGNGLVQYVMFARRKNAERLLRHYGQDLLSEIRNKIALNGCEHLIV